MWGLGSWAQGLKGLGCSDPALPQQGPSRRRLFQGSHFRSRPCCLSRRGKGSESLRVKSRVVRGVERKNEMGMGCELGPSHLGRPSQVSVRSSADASRARVGASSEPLTDTASKAALAAFGPPARSLVRPSSDGRPPACRVSLPRSLVTHSVVPASPGLQSALKSPGRPGEGPQVSRRPQVS